MKKFLVLALTFMLMLTLVGCGNTNANLASNMNNSLNKLNNYIKNIDTISDSQIVVSDLISDTAITTMRNTKPSDKISTAEELGIKNVGGNAFVVPNYNRNTDTYGNYYNINNRFGYGYNGFGNNGYGFGYGIGYGYPYGFGGYPYGYNYNLYNNGSNGFNGNGLVGTNIDTYRDNVNYNNLYNRVYRNNNLVNTPIVNETTNKRFNKNINTYRDIATNINTYKKANYESRYNANIGYETDLNNHYQKLNNLCAIQIDTLNCNDKTNSLKTRILANISYLNSLAEQIKSGNINVSDTQAKAVKDLLNNANNFANKINTSKNELSTELKSVNNMKVNYSANVDELSSKYIRLLNSLDTRNSYLQNILSSLLQVENTILSNSYYDTSILDEESLSTCPNCENTQVTMPPPKRDIKEAEVEGIIDISGSRTKITTDENGKQIESSDEFQDRYLIENGKISKYPKIKTSDDEIVEDVNNHIVKEKPDKLEDKDVNKLRIAGEKIASFIKNFN